MALMVIAACSKVEPTTRREVTDEFWGAGGGELSRALRILPIWSRTRRQKKRSGKDSSS